ncbi:MAG: HXXEE domain-containing protein [Bacteroidota bacterium]
MEESLVLIVIGNDPSNKGKMDNSKFLLGSIVLLFAMLWLPFGQYSFLIDNWMKIGTYAVPFLLIGAFSRSSKSVSTNSKIDYRVIAIIMLIAYIIHQYEEHWIDLFGNYYAFYVFNNDFILGNLGAADSSAKPLTKAAIFMINTSLVWLVGVLAIWRSSQHLFPLIAMASIIVVNGLVHLLAGVAKFQYNPGLLTSVLIFIPLYVWFVRRLLKLSKSYKPQVVGGMIWAFLAHVIMVGGLLMANWFNVISEPVYFMVLIVWSVIPLGIFPNSRIKERSAILNSIEE